MNLADFLPVIIVAVIAGVVSALVMVAMGVEETAVIGGVSGAIAGSASVGVASRRSRESRSGE